MNLESAVTEVRDRPEMKGRGPPRPLLTEARDCL